MQSVRSQCGVFRPSCKAPLRAVSIKAQPKHLAQPPIASRRLVPAHHAGKARRIVLFAASEVVSTDSNASTTKVEAPATSAPASPVAPADNKASIVPEELKANDLVQGVVQHVSRGSVVIDLGLENLPGKMQKHHVSSEPFEDMKQVFKKGDQVTALVRHSPAYTGCKYVPLSTKALEKAPGDMLRNPQLVYERAQEVAAARRSRASLNESAFKVGEVLEGVVESVAKGRAIVVIGNTYGLLDFKALSQERISRDSLGTHLALGEKIKAMVILREGRKWLSTKELEPSPGDMLRNKQAVWEQAEEMAEKWRAAGEQQQQQQAGSSGGSEGGHVQTEGAAAGAA